MTQSKRMVEPELPAKPARLTSLTHSAAHRVNTKHSYKEGKS